MEHAHHHHHGHHHLHHTIDLSSHQAEKRLWWAVVANGLLTVAQIVGGLLSGSLSLIADAVHNLSDAASLVIALIAVRLGRKPADHTKTFGYRRAETVAALVNLTTLILIGLYLCGEAVHRFINPQPVVGGTVMIVAGVALTVDLFTAFLTYKHSKTSLNIRAAFLHNMADALGSVGVIIAGAAIYFYGWVWMDTLMTFVIAGYILWHGVIELPRAIHILMEGSPEHIDAKEVVAAMEACDGVKNIHHVHLWQPDESMIAMEAHVVVDAAAPMDDVKTTLKTMLKDKFDIAHSTLEFEHTNCGQK